MFEGIKENCNTAWDTIQSKISTYPDELPVNWFHQGVLTSAAWSAGFSYLVTYNPTCALLGAVYAGTESLLISVTTPIFKAFAHQGVYRREQEIARRVIFSLLVGMVLNPGEVTVRFILVAFTVHCISVKTAISMKAPPELYRVLLPACV